MKPRHFLLVVLSGLVVTSVARAQVTRIVIPAGTPEDAAIQEISKESDADKRLTLVQDFLQKFAGNPMAAAYGNVQISQYYSAKVTKLWPPLPTILKSLARRRTWPYR